MAYPNKIIDMINDQCTTYVHSFCAVNNNAVNTLYNEFIGSSDALPLKESSIYGKQPGTKIELNLILKR
jgi:hypothetical protein